LLGRIELFSLVAGTITQYDSQLILQFLNGEAISKKYIKRQTVNDTHPDIAIKFQELIMSKSGEQRLLMGFSMYDTARRIVQSALASQRPEITAREMREGIFTRFYGHEFTDAEKKKILSALASQ